MTYSEKQEEVRHALGVEETATGLVERWSFLIEECEAGYHWDVSEFGNELRARDQLEKILLAPDLQYFEEHAVLIGRVHDLDEQFRRLLQSDVRLPGRKEWWRQGVLRFSGEQYARFMETAYGFRVEVVDD